MKTFKDLDFKPHPNMEGKQAVMIFENGYGVSVVRFKHLGSYGSYTINEEQWEVAVIKTNDHGWNINYDTEITDDVLGYQSESDVTNIMERVQKLNN